MTSHQLQTKADKVDEIRDSLLEKYLKRKCSNVISPESFDFASAKKRIENLSEKRINSDEAIAYNSAMGILYAAQGRFSKARTEYKKVMHLVPKFGDHFLNYSSILIGAGDFEVAKKDLEECLYGDENRFSVLLNLFYCSRWDLDFSIFKHYYEFMEEKCLLPPSSRGVLKFHYDSLEQWESLKADLSSIGVDIALYSEFYSLLSKFQAQHFYNSLEVCFEMDQDDECLLVDVYGDLSDSEALMLISKFEKYMVKYAITNNKRELLSKFLVFFKDKSMIEEEYPCIYSRSDSLVV